MRNQGDQDQFGGITPQLQGWTREDFKVETNQQENPDHDRSTHFIQLLTSHQPNLYAYISTMVLGDTAASDLLQETNLHLWAQASQYDFSRPFLPWAFGFARQRVMAFRKSCSRSRLVFDDATLSVIDDKVTSSVSEIDDRLSALQKCLKKLSPQQAELIRERYMAKTPVMTMADRLNQTAHNISSSTTSHSQNPRKVYRIHLVGGGALMDSLERRFTQLTSRALDGLCTDDERAELTRLASQRPELAAGVVDEAILHAILKWYSGNITKGFFPPEFPLDVTQDATVEPKHSPPVVSARRFLWVIAAVLLVTCGVATWQGYYARQAADSVIADIVDRSGVRWADDSTALSDDKTIVTGRLASLGGEYTLQFRSGPTVRVVGAASLDIKSNMLIELDQGQVTAQVPASSIGFTINSPLVNVIDQGTQFGISVGSGRADVVVFDGKVDLQSKVGNGGGHTRLTQGDSVQIDQRGAISRLADVRRDVKGRWWTDDRDSDKHVIARVSDNIHSGDGGKTFACYQTTFDGLHDDVLAYSDNPHHQWNGLTADGLPAFLRGADYIKTFNDYRYMEYFEMRVELARPANLYIFFDDRVETPDWLKANFEDTGVDIGLDEGPWLLKADELKEVDLQKYRELDVNTTAVGSGNSIDNVFSVWRRRCVDGGTVSLGPVGMWRNDRVEIGGEGGRAMFGIAATPLDVENAADESLSSPDGA